MGDTAISVVRRLVLNPSPRACGRYICRSIFSNRKYLHPRACGRYCISDVDTGLSSPAPSRVWAVFLAYRNGTFDSTRTVVIPDVGSRDDRNSHPFKAATPLLQLRAQHPRHNLVCCTSSGSCIQSVYSRPAARSLALPAILNTVANRYGILVPCLLSRRLLLPIEVPRPAAVRALCAVSGSLRGQCTPIPCAVLLSCLCLLLPSFCCPQLQKILTFRLKPF